MATNPPDLQENIPEKPSLAAFTAEEERELEELMGDD